MRAKAVGVITAFTALATVLNLVKFPAPYLPICTYQLGDIILVVAFFLFGLEIGFSVAILNMVVTMSIYASIVGVVGAPYYLVAVLTMLFGSYAFLKIIKKRSLTKTYGDAKSITYATLFAVLSRTLIMLLLDLSVYKYLVSIVTGWSITESFNNILISLPGTITYNITVPLFVIPISYYVSKHVTKHFDSMLFTKSII